MYASTLSPAALASLVDAGELRVSLAADLADWNASGFWPSHRIHGFNLRVRVLARLLGKTTEEVLDDLAASSSFDRMVLGGAA